MGSTVVTAVYIITFSQVVTSGMFTTDIGDHLQLTFAATIYDFITDIYCKIWWLLLLWRCYLLTAGELMTHFHTFNLPLIVKSSLLAQPYFIIET